MALNDTLCRESLYEKMENYSLPSFDNMTYFREPYIFKYLSSTDYVKIVAYIFIIVGGLLGNISIILTVALNRSMRTTINYYVANLAVADALICLFCMGPHVINTMTSPVFALGEIMCKFNPFTQMVCLTSSVLTLSAISCDRFVAIMFPLHVRITKQRTSIVMQIVWLISLAVSIPFLIVKKHMAIQFKNFLEPRCNEQWPLDSYWDDDIFDCVDYYRYQTSYYLTVSVTLYFLPVVVMITAYSLILWKLWMSEVPGERHVQNINVQYRARKKVIKMVFVVLLAFILCWTPLQVLVLLYTFPGNFEESLMEEVDDGNCGMDLQEPEWFGEFKWFAYFLAYANSFINPIIYGGFNKTFREGFCIVLKCGFRRNGFNRPPRSRLTFTTGVTSSPSRFTSRIINGANKTASQKSDNIEMKSMCTLDEVNLPMIKNDVCVTAEEIH